MFGSGMVLKKRALLICAMIFSGSAISNSNIESGSVASESARLAASFPVMAVQSEGKTSLAVGERGHILSHKHGQWQQVGSPTDVLFTNLALVGETHAWAVGHDGTIVASSDSGSSWQLQQYLPSTDRPLLDIHFVDNLRGVAIGAYGMYFATNDGGKNWSKQFLASLLPQGDIEYLEEIRKESESEYQYEISSILPHFNQIIGLSGERLLMVGELGLIALSDDLGKNWRRLPDVYEGSFFSALATTNQTLLVGGLRGNLFRSVDDGRQWQKISLTNEFSINQIRQFSNGDIYISQNNGVILKSTDDGQSFQTVALYKGQDILGITEVDGQLWLGTSKGLLSHQEQHQVEQ